MRVHGPILDHVYVPTQETTLLWNEPHTLCAMQVKRMQVVFMLATRMHLTCWRASSVHRPFNRLWLNHDAHQVLTTVSVADCLIRAPHPAVPGLHLDAPLKFCSQHIMFVPPCCAAFAAASHGATGNGKP
jgi:hypothetical protein